MSGPPADVLTRPLDRFVAALERLEEAPPIARPRHQSRLLDSADRLLRVPGGAAAAYGYAPRFDAAGVFAGSDWDHPELLLASLVPKTLAAGDRLTITLECLSLLRLVALAEGKGGPSGLSSEQARNYLLEVLALCLEYVFERQTEAARVQRDRVAAAGEVLRFVAQTVGHADLLDQLVAEIWRLLRQRPLHVAPVCDMITRLSIYCYDPEHVELAMPVGAERLISSLYSPSPGSREDPGTEVYADRLAKMDPSQLQEEASACARSMHDTGLVSPYHAVLVRALLEDRPDLLALALGLSTTGLDSYLTYRELVHSLIDVAVHPETCQCVYGLASLLERAVLHSPGVAASLWRQVKLPLADAAKARIAAACGTSRPPEVFLHAGVCSILGQPLGVGQGDNPTCQSARALSLWSYSDPVYLLQLLTWAARDDSVSMTYHGQNLSSAAIEDVQAGRIGSDLDPVSLVLVPHLDRLYNEMLRRAETAHEDPHIHVNPEFHGWHVGRGCAIAVDVPTGRLENYEDFVRLFCACYHPAYNGGRPVIHPQPVGLAVTDSLARFVGWHAITVLRVTLDHEGAVRVYFYNPNNDKGQDWGHRVVVSTEGHGELPGESSLPVVEFASRLYLFHYDPLEVSDQSAVGDDVVEKVTTLGRESWAAARLEEVPPS